MRKALAVLLMLSLALSAFPGGAGAEDARYRNFYEVFVYSFCDSDGDGIGDINGVTQKLDYIADMGFTGIWLMPVMPSPSYHKYDVTDYYAIDPAYGTMDDFRALLRGASERGITVLIDLVLNHTSDQHPWFTSASGNPDSPYRAFYQFSDTPRSGYAQRNGEYYECRFAETMPDLNLDSPAVREALADIIAYWLNLGVGGFRLDACTSFYTGARESNVAFLRWVGETARAILPDCFLVGEVWANAVEIAAYYESGIDALFYFPAAQHDGIIARALRGNAKAPGEIWGKAMSDLATNFSGRLLAPFLGNHDTGRAASFLVRDADKIKLAAGLLCLMPGSVFVYYGDEIGMTGSGDDPNKRVGMLWAADAQTTQLPPGAKPAKYSFGSVEEQLADEASILRYYRRALWLRRTYPLLMRGALRVLPQDNADVCLIAREEGGETLYVAANLSAKDAMLALPDALSGAELCAHLAVSGEAVLSGGMLALPPYGIALMR